MIGAEELRREHLESWLERGGVVLASTDRAARSLLAMFDAGRRAEGKRGWATPAIFGWDSWVRDSWVQDSGADRNREGLVLLNPLQERALWGRVIAESAAGASMLKTGRLADAAMQAARLLAEFAPESLRASAQQDWAEDAGVFSGWLGEFDKRCRRDGLLSAGRLVLKLTTAVEGKPEDRPPLLLIGFDRLLATQRVLLDAWGRWELEAAGERAAKTSYFRASDGAAEVGACVQWLHGRLAANPSARLMVVTTGLDERRGELERALGKAGGQEFEFSLGVPLGRVGLIRAALMFLRWLREPLAEAELDWLIGSEYVALSAEESLVLAETMRAIRSWGRERPEWTLGDFAQECNQPGGIAEGWKAQMMAAQEVLKEAPTRQGAMEWVQVVGDVLEAAGWPGYRVLGSVGFQARRRWERVLEDCGSLGLNGERMEWSEFFRVVAEAVSGTIFALESGDAPIEITEPIAAAGQVADGVWFLGVSEENWPGRGQPNPLLPLGLQRESGMPHASSQLDWDLAEVATARLLGSADEVIFSFAQQGTDPAAGAEVRPSRLALRHLGTPTDLPSSDPWCVATEARQAETEAFAETYEDWSRIPFPGKELRGGAGALTRQSVCAFQGFGIARLGAQTWDPAETGLNAKQRGQMLHAVLKKVWAGKVLGGIATSGELQAIGDLRGFVGGLVRRVMAEEFDQTQQRAIPARFPARFLVLEAERLTRLVCEWLEYERGRVAFRVEGVEVSREVTVAGLKLRVRLDRVDVLDNCPGDEPEGVSRLVMDYKTGRVSQKAWTGIRPDDVQLPLYATYAFDEEPAGLVFAKLRPGEMAFDGRVRDARASLLPWLHASTGLVKNPLTVGQLEEWRELIEQLGQDFVEGRAEVDPKDPVRICERCGLHGVCRIYENQSLTAMVAAEEDSAVEMNGEAGDE